MALTKCFHQQEHPSLFLPLLASFITQQHNNYDNTNTQYDQYYHDLSSGCGATIILTTTGSHCGQGSWNLGWDKIMGQELGMENIS
jgi:hypothetical protein